MSSDGEYEAQLVRELESRERQLVALQQQTEERLTRLEKLADFAEQTLGQRDRWAAEACRLAAQLGWQPFGTDTGSQRGRLEFDGKDSSGMPLWERVHVEHEVQLNAFICDSPYVSDPEALLRALHERFEVRRRSS